MNLHRKVFLFNLIAIILFICTLLILTRRDQAIMVSEEPTVVIETVAETEENSTGAIEEPAEVDPSADYRTYLPVYDNTMEHNLYDDLEEKCLIYFRREGCEDCEKYETSILRQMEESGYPYHILEVSKTPEEWQSGLAIKSSVVKSIGISEVPTVAFVSEGIFQTRIENHFTEDGDEIIKTCTRVFEE